MSNTKNQNYLQGAAVLAVSVVIIKILGAIYKIPLYNILGTSGTTDFNVAYNIYNVLLTLSTAGLPVALSRMISEANTLDRPMQVRRTFHVALATFLVLGSIGTLIMFLFPVELAAAMSEVEAAQSIRALSPAVVLVCLMSAYRGYAQGHENMTPTAVSQVIEVLVKVVFGLILAWILASAGKSAPIVSAGAIAGVGVGSLFALIYTWRCKGKIDRQKTYPRKNLDNPESWGKTLKKLLRIGIPIALGSSVLSLMTLIDTKLTLYQLQGAAGFGFNESKELFGEYSYAMTLFNLPSNVVTTLTISVVPAIAAKVAMRDNGGAKRIAESSLRIATLLTLPMGVGLSVLASPVMNVLYWGQVTETGTAMLTIMGIASYFVCMSLMTTAILQANGNEQLPMISMVAGAVVKIGVNWVLVGNPDINIMGSPIGTLCCYIVMCLLNVFFIQRKVAGKINLGKILIRPAVSAAVMGAAAWAVYGLASRLLGGGEALGRIPMAVAMVAAIGVAVIVYLVLIIVLRAITAEDMRLIPKGEKLAKLLKIK